MAGASEHDPRRTPPIVNGSASLRRDNPSLGIRKARASSDQLNAPPRDSEWRELLDSGELREKLAVELA
jgi:hypothetical protein